MSFRSGDGKLQHLRPSSLRDNFVYVLDISDGINEVEKGPNPIALKPYYLSVSQRKDCLLHHDSLYEPFHVIPLPRLSNTGKAKYSVIVSWRS